MDLIKDYDDASKLVVPVTNRPAKLFQVITFIIKFDLSISIEFKCSPPPHLCVSEKLQSLTEDGHAVIGSHDNGEHVVVPAVKGVIQDLV